MAKCPICNSRKGKRKCLITNDMICSLCCGSTRTEAACSKCMFYQKPKRNYHEVPAYSVSDMEDNMEFISYGNSIEGALCTYDIKKEGKLNDNDAIRIIELLIDRYHFQDQHMNNENQMITDGVHYVERSMIEDLENVENEDIVKILGAIRFVAKRRTKTGREYMTLIQHYIGQRIGSGIRILQQ
jgi:hypothetical protein